MSGSHLLDSLGDHTLLTAAEERRLLYVAQDRDGRRASHRAKERLLRHNVRLVARVASRFTPPPGMDDEDLMQAGMIGIMRAIEKFDTRSGHRFSTYAVPWIRQAVSRQIENHASLVRVPVHVRQKHAAVRRAEAGLRNRIGRDPTPEEIARETGRDPHEQEALQRALKVAATPASLDAPLAPHGEPHEYGARPLSERLDDGGASLDPAEAAAARIDSAALRGRLADALAVLPEKQARVLDLRFGLGGTEPLTLAATGEVVGLSQEAVRNYQKRALAALRRTLEGAQRAEREDAA